ncbi:MAG: hypothetical protein KDA96_24540, partial [Planctomycetaceae bacterium]|nr:hypothetical protein [Planctomycetaceae bacterium]
MTTDNNLPRWMHHTIVVLVMLVCVNLLSHRSIDPDLWGHIQYGEDWMSTGHLPQTATHTYTAEGYRWINHENLSELVLAVSQRLIGGHGIMALRTLAGIAVLAILLRLAVRRGVPILAAAVILIPVSHALAEFWVARPQLSSFLYFTVMCLLLEKAFRDWHEHGKVHRRWLAAIVPLMIVWVNSHGGFAAGLCILSAVFGLRLIECFIRFRSEFSANLVTFGILGALCFGSMFVNPYGVELPRWMFAALGKPRPEISEWASMWESGRTVIPFTIITAITLAATLLTRERRDIVQLMIIAIVTVQAWIHLRHLAF